MEKYLLTSTAKKKKKKKKIVFAKILDKRIQNVIVGREQQPYIMLDIQTDIFKF